MKEIILPKGNKAFVDDEDFDRVNCYKWNYGDRYIKSKTVNRETIYIHRFIMSAQKGFEVDHIDGNKFNNQKSNLRVCKRSENEWNKGIQKNNTSGLKGVYWHKSKDKWCAKIQSNNKRILLGYFLNKEDAKVAYNEAALKYHGKFAYINK